MYGSTTIWLERTTYMFCQIHCSICGDHLNPPGLYNTIDPCMLKLITIWFTRAQFIVNYGIRFLWSSPLWPFMKYQIYLLCGSSLLLFQHHIICHGYWYRSHKNCVILNLLADNNKRQIFTFLFCIRSHLIYIKMLKLLSAYRYWCFPS